MRVGAGVRAARARCRRTRRRRTDGVLELDEAEAAGLPRVLVAHQRHVEQLAILPKVIAQSSLGEKTAGEVRFYNRERGPTRRTCGYLGGLPAHASYKKLALGVAFTVAHGTGGRAPVVVPIMSTSFPAENPKG